MLVPARLERSLSRRRRSAPRLFCGDECREPLRFVRLEAEETQTAGKVVAWVFFERVDDPRCDALAPAVDVIEAEFDVLSGFEGRGRLDAGTPNGQLVDDDRLAIAIW